MASLNTPIGYGLNSLSRIGNLDRVKRPPSVIFPVKSPGNEDLAW